MPWGGHIAADMRKFEITPGRCVWEFTVRIGLRPTAGVTDEQVRALRERVDEALDDHVNGRYRLPDYAQIHVRADFDATDTHTDVTVRPEAVPGERSDQRTWLVNESGRVLAGQITRYAGFVHDFGLSADSAPPDTRR
ncbi:hypothetical protein [Saccharopolyspora thermophila]|uniref:hypothetical protein n=1 Tax=Saccharopolyspora thermophila TaxID=89367 RepID=UPI0016675776|nr:hypothetical protein [Saccharopolyspora subtropica]